MKETGLWICLTKKKKQQIRIQSERVLPERHLNHLLSAGDRHNSTHLLLSTRSSSNLPIRSYPIHRAARAARASLLLLPGLVGLLYSLSGPPDNWSGTFN